MPVEQISARDYLPQRLIERARTQMDNHRRRVTFRPPGSARSITEAPFDEELLEEIREHLRPYSPVRLYFGDDPKIIARRREERKADKPRDMRDRAIYLVRDQGFRVPTVGMYFGISRKILANWGCRHPTNPRQEADEASPERAAQLYMLGMEHACMTRGGVMPHEVIEILKGETNRAQRTVRRTLTRMGVLVEYMRTRPDMMRPGVDDYESRVTS